MLLKPKYQIVIAGLCLAIVAILSLMIGNTLVSPGTVIQALFNFDSETIYMMLSLVHGHQEQSLRY
ncbi:hypothetical protein T9H88_04245 [Staphylococcus aureus]|nr:hypothetical protein T9H88_04245 [Staphylococcus aureus]